MKLAYESLERLSPRPPVDRLEYIAGACRDKIVLDIGCYDETALVKVDTRHWLHGRIAEVAKRVVGIDSSSKIPEGGLKTAPNARIHRGDGVKLAPPDVASAEIELIVAGEFIEHIEQPLGFFRALKKQFPGREAILSTPNGGQFANTLMGALGREIQHHDHIQIFTYKILNTLCLRAGFQDWEIIPYRFYATEMILTSTGLKRLTAQFTQSVIRVVEHLFPLLSFGYIIRVRL